MKLSKRISKTKTSATIAMSMKARELIAQGKDIISLSAGEPDFDTPEHIKKAAIKSIKSGNTKYTPVDGMLPLKKAIVKKFTNENKLDYSEDQILVSAGCKQSIYNLCQATLDEGDEVLIPSPYWVSYPEIVKLSDAVPVFIETNSDTDFKVTGKMLEKHITSKTKMLLLNSPSNPSGFVYSEADLKDIGNILKKHPEIIIASDDIYEHIIFSKKNFTNILNVCPELYDQTIILNGVSKAYCMTGWRLGYCGARKEIISGMNKIQSQSNSSTSSISMAASVEALQGNQDFIEKHNIAFKKRRDLVVEKLNSIDGISCGIPPGAFYVYPNCEGIIGRKTPDGIILDSDEKFMNYLLESRGVAGVQGEAFGLSPYFRLSYATSEKILIEACHRIDEACKLLK